MKMWIKEWEKYIKFDNFSAYIKNIGKNIVSLTCHWIMVYNNRKTIVKSDNFNCFIQYGIL